MEFLVPLFLVVVHPLGQIESGATAFADVEVAEPAVTAY